MPLQPEKLPTMPLSELVQELHKREDSLDHLMAKADHTSADPGAA